MAFQALSAVLGGTQSLHTNSMDEALALPSQEAVQIALRTQQLIAYETGVTETVDPLAGSYYIEHLTNTIEKPGPEYIRRIDELGGAAAAIEKGFVQREIQESAYRYQKGCRAGRRGSWSVSTNSRSRSPSPPVCCGWIRWSREQQIKKLNAAEGERDNTGGSGLPVRP